ncbi:hypothetical protein [Streptomyces varsoviensis]|uniref:Uncharacterized protein n=2 Tax=Streptomyces varsoviensis TaxID=67373 RepID=A0ABR5IW58_9ACTN|nr:hypothetical protein [Streptomyces varsoviensis]KOG85196.1 hypothetical protein ADK38_38040 [Streptomyces varsoviensis]
MTSGKWDNADLDVAMERRGLWRGRSPWIRRAVRELPRHRFAPDRLWRWDGWNGEGSRAYVPLDREAEAEAGRWAAEVYAGPDEPAVTQVRGWLATTAALTRA